AAQAQVVVIRVVKRPGRLKPQQDLGEFVHVQAVRRNGAAGHGVRHSSRGRLAILCSDYDKAGGLGHLRLDGALLSRRWRSSSRSRAVSSFTGRGGIRFSGSYRKARQWYSTATTPCRGQATSRSLTTAPLAQYPHRGSMSLRNSMETPSSSKNTSHAKQRFAKKFF